MKLASLLGMTAILVTGCSDEQTSQRTHGEGQRQVNQTKEQGELNATGLDPNMIWAERTEEGIVASAMPSCTLADSVYTTTNKTWYLKYDVTCTAKVVLAPTGCDDYSPNNPSKTVVFTNSDRHTVSHPQGQYNPKPDHTTLDEDGRNKYQKRCEEDEQVQESCMQLGSTISSADLNITYQCGTFNFDIVTDIPTGGGPSDSSIVGSDYPAGGDTGMESL